MRWMIYGANGYSGELIARNARGKGLSPVLAGRTERHIAPLAEQLGLEYRCFALDDVDCIAEQLADIDLIIHCAGPFSQTAKKMFDGCLQARTHYLDITGEVAVLEYLHTQAGRARSAGIIACPAVGFDVIPTDCLASRLHQALPDANYLRLGFSSASQLSPGTARTIVESLSKGGRARIDDQLRQVPLAWKTDRIDFGRGPEWAMTIPWGDLCTAWHSTGIANIDVFVPAPRWLIWATKASNLARPLLGLDIIQSYLMSLVDKKIKGPDEAERARHPTFVWGQVRNNKGEQVTGTLKTTNAYSLTVDGALAIRQYLEDHTPSPGCYTPSQLCGSELIENLPGSGVIKVE